MLRPIRAAKKRMSASADMCSESRRRGVSASAREDRWAPEIAPPISGLPEVGRI
jgi:hypothetical protein